MASDRTFDTLLAASGLPRVEARALLEHVSGRTREFLVAHGSDPCPEAIVDRFVAFAERRRAGEPLAYLVGSREFRGLRFFVDDAVLIPRPETEELVDEALGLVAGRGAPVIVDLGTGSGVIAICLALARPDARVLATDRCARALAVAGRNAGLHRATLEFREGDWWDAVAAAPAPWTADIDLVVSNPPYIAADDPHLGRGDLRHEPLAALAPGPVGTEAIERIAAIAPQRLRRGGWLVLEHGHDQGPAVAAILARAGLESVATRADLAGLDRITRGRRG